MLSLALCVGLATAFVPPASMQQLARAQVQPSASCITMGAKPRPQGAKGLLSKRPKPLSPGSNYPTTKNIQTQKSGFGTFVQKFQLAQGKSKYGVPIFLPNGNVNPKYLAAERAEMKAQSQKNTNQAEAKRKKLISKKEFELADYVRKKIGEVGSGASYYQSGR